MQATFCSMYADDLATLKLAALYFDKVTLPVDGGAVGPVTPAKKLRRSLRTGDLATMTVSATFWTRPKAVERQIKLLVDAGIVVLAETSDLNSVAHSAFEDAFDKELAKLPREPDGRVFCEFNPDLLLARPPEVDLGLVRSVYTSLARSAFTESLRADSAIVTDVPMLDAMLTDFLKRKVARAPNLAKAKSGFLAQRVLSEALPNIGHASFEDILEVRQRFKDDLGDFRAAMAGLSNSIRSHPWSADIEQDVARIVEAQVKPKVADLGRSLRMSNLMLVKNLFRNLQNPRTYVPFVGTALLHMEPALAALAGAGIAGFGTLFDTYIQRRKIKDASGLTFLLKASRALDGGAAT